MSQDSAASGSGAGEGVASTIEFHCSGCGRQLRVASSYAGRSAKCPQCGVVQAIPQPRVETPLTLEPTPADWINSGVLTPVPSSAPTSPLIQPPNQSVPTQTYPNQVVAAQAPATHTPPTHTLPTHMPPAWQPAPQTAPTMAPQMGMAPAAAPSYGAQPYGTQPGATPAPFTASFPQAARPVAAPARSSMSVTAPSIESGRTTPTKQLFDRILGEISKIYVGQQELVISTLVALFSNGHVLIESVPGLGKTLFVRTLGRVLGCRFGRIQFTADLMPSDITGAPIFDMKTQEFRFRPGPIFTQLLLADEINRAPAKTHAALLEIMQEFRVTVDGKSHPLDRPFLVLATQNPIESEGTYNLPEAQLDRFMFKLVAEYPREQEEAEILKLHSQQIDINSRLETELETVTSPDDILRIMRENGDVRVDDRLIDYINKIVRATRQWPQFHLGASPRAGLAIMQAARTLAAFHGRDYAVPDDVVQIALPALRHRVILTAEAEVEGQKVDDLLTELIRTIEVPRL